MSTIEQTTNGSAGYIGDKPKPLGVQISAYTYPSMALRELRAYSNVISGKVKTIVDATITDPRQAKAVKDLVHSAVWDTYTEVLRWAGMQTPECGSSFPFGTPNDVPLPVAL